MERGQASADYIGIVTLVALVLAVAGAVAAPDLPAALAHHARMALCVVGGDVCRAGDAERAGLEPCVVRVREGEQHTRVTIALVSYGHGRAFAVERRSDGSARVVVSTDHEGGVTAAVGVQLGPNLEVGVDASGSVGWRSGRAWELPDEAALQRFLAGVRQDPGMFETDLDRREPAPAGERFSAVTGASGAEAGARILGLEQGLGGVSGRGAIGRRSGGGRTAWYFDARQEGPHLFGGLVPAIELGRGGAWTIELLDRPRELRLRAALSGGVEMEGRLDLTVPANAAAVRDVLSRPTPARARAMGRHIAEHGTVQRRVYRTRELPSDTEVGLALGAAGVDHRGSAQERTLVSAEVLRPGGASARRADCLGF